MTMGVHVGAIRSVVQQLDPSSQALEEQQQLVETLARLAESKAEFFELQIRTSMRTAGGSENDTIPVEAVLDSVTETHAYSGKSSANIGDSVTRALKSFCGGSKDEIINGVGTLITDGLSTFLGDASASDTTMQRYYVMAEGFSIVRIDLCAWQFNVDAKGIQGAVEKVGAFVAVKSAVDLSKVRFNTFLNIYARQLESMQLESQALETALEEAKRVFHSFGTEDVTA
ncbi:hypothetical protein [Streptomyces cyaneofuscatus]|uniref:hypothetical protein n=1 Tax=Streptomyces cyaneofuscatus TaxID=66883 RepID=UPI002F9111CD